MLVQSQVRRCSLRRGVRYPHLQLRRSTYYFRRPVPEELRTIIGKRELIESLATKDREEAKRRCHAKDVEVDRLFAAALEAARRGVELSQPEAEALARQWLDKALSEDADSRALGRYRLPTLEVVEASDDLAQTELAEAREALAEGDLSKVERQLELFLPDQGMALPRGSEPWRRLAHAFLRANVQYWERINERLAGLWREDHRNGVPAAAPTVAPARPPKAAPPVTPQADASGATGEPLSEVYEKYKRERRPSPKTAADWNAAFRRFIEVNGDLPVRAITRAHVRDFKDHLLTRPGRSGRATAGEPPRVAAGTVKKALAGISAVLAWAVENDYCEANPAAGMRVRDPEPNREKRLPYDAGDLKAIFGSPVYASGERPAAGAGQAAFWLPLLALFTGARLEELGQLLVSDVKQATAGATSGGHTQGVWFLDINTIDEGKSLKTRSSRRRVPIHPELIRLGFLKYVEARPSGSLWPDLKPDNKGKLTGNWSKWWGRYARQEAGIADRRKVFHSFRHTFKDATRAAGIEEALSDALTGHTGGGVGRTYGRGYPIEKLADAVARIRYPGESFVRVGRHLRDALRAPCAG